MRKTDKVFWAPCKCGCSIDEHSYNWDELYNKSWETMSKEHRLVIQYNEKLRLINRCRKCFMCDKFKEMSNLECCEFVSQGGSL